MADDQDMTVGQVAKFCGVSADTVRRWEERGVLSPSRRLPGSGHRRYSKRDVEEALRAVGLAASDATTRLAGPPDVAIWDADPATAGRYVVHTDVMREPVDARIAGLLDVPEGTAVVVRTRTFRLEGRPALLARSYIPVDVAARAGLEQEDTGPGGMYARLREVGLGPTRYAELSDAVPATTAEQTIRLEVTEGAPLHAITRLAEAADGTVVEVNDMVAVPGVYPPRRYRWDA